jgi:tetratricopeptide (TPR) repeat protein
VASSGKEVYCLCIDLIGATKFGFELNTRQQDQFNNSLVEQLKPHLESVGLTKTLIKFTGDGWLIMVDKVQQVAPLCCLAIIMASRFQSEISSMTEISNERIPALRLAIGFGRDVKVKLPNGHTDWVGDSARRAVRTSGFCLPNEILISESIKATIFRDFETLIIDVDSRPIENRPKRSEESFALYKLGSIKEAAAIDSEAPEHFVNTLSIIGRQGEAENFAAQVSQRLEMEALKPRTDKEILLVKWNRLMASRLDYSTALEIFSNIRDARLNPNIYTYNTLLGKAPDYKIAVQIMEQMRKDDIQPNVITYNTLINLAPDYAEASRLMEQMRKDDIQPDVITYNTLINLALTHDEAVRLMEQMRKDDIQPDVITYSTLINLAPDYAEASRLMEQMRKDDIQPDVITYSTLINLAPDYAEASQMMEQMRKDDIQPNVITYNTLIKLAPDYAEATGLIERMVNESVEPNSYTYSTLFSKDLSDVSADSILSWFLRQKYHPELSIQAAIASYRKLGRIEQALRLALDYPHLPAARKLIRQHSDTAITYFRNIYEDNPLHPNACYALTIALTELESIAEAQQYALEAFDLAREGPRKKALAKLIQQIDIKQRNISEGNI